jgi:dTDP-4-dehydrorhamnose reductase
MTLERSEKGWIAAVTIDRYLSTCYVFDGEVKPPYPHLERRRPSCVKQ